MTCIEETKPENGQPELGVVRHAQRSSAISYRQSLGAIWNWKRTLVAAGVGLIVGVMVAHEIHPRSAALFATTNFSSMAESAPPPELLPVSSTVVEIKLPASPRSASVEPQVSANSEVQKLQVRNRRLEALVQALRQREGNAAQSAPENKD